MAGKIIIKTWEGYKNVRDRVAKGIKYFETNDILDPKNKKVTDEYNKLASAMLFWELEHDLIPDKLDRAITEADIDKQMKRENIKSRYSIIDKDLLIDS